MIHPVHILALSNRAFVTRQLANVFCGGRCEAHRASFWNGWGFEPVA